MLSENLSQKLKHIIRVKYIHCTYVYCFQIQDLLIISSFSFYNTLRLTYHIIFLEMRQSAQFSHLTKTTITQNNPQKKLENHFHLNLTAD